MESLQGQNHVFQSVDGIPNSADERARRVYMDTFIRYALGIDNATIGRFRTQVTLDYFQDLAKLRFVYVAEEWLDFMIDYHLWRRLFKPRRVPETPQFPWVFLPHDSSKKSSVMYQSWRMSHLLPADTTGTMRDEVSTDEDLGNIRTTYRPEDEHKDLKTDFPEKNRAFGADPISMGGYFRWTVPSVADQTGFDQEMDGRPMESERATGSGQSSTGFHTGQPSPDQTAPPPSSSLIFRGQSEQAAAGPFGFHSGLPNPDQTAPPPSSSLIFRGQSEQAAAGPFGFQTTQPDASQAVTLPFGMLTSGAQGDQAAGPFGFHAGQPNPDQAAFLPSDHLTFRDQSAQVAAGPFGFHAGQPNPDQTAPPPSSSLIFRGESEQAAAGPLSPETGQSIPHQAASSSPDAQILGTEGARGTGGQHTGPEHSTHSGSSDAMEVDDDLPDDDLPDMGRLNVDENDKDTENVEIAPMHEGLAEYWEELKRSGHWINSRLVTSTFEIKLPAACFTNTLLSQYRTIQTVNVPSGLLYIKRRDESDGILTFAIDVSLHCRGSLSEDQKKRILDIWLCMVRWVTVIWSGAVIEWEKWYFLWNNKLYRPMLSQASEKEIFLALEVAEQCAMEMLSATCRGEDGIEIAMREYLEVLYWAQQLNVEYTMKVTDILELDSKKSKNMVLDDICALVAHLKVNPDMEVLNRFFHIGMTAVYAVAHSNLEEGDRFPIAQEMFLKLQAIVATEPTD